MPSHSTRHPAVFAAATLTVCALALAPVTAASAAIVADPITYSADDADYREITITTFAVSDDGSQGTESTATWTRR